ncbi:GNAT family N-acetyltransferase [Parasedimentitalea marina]|uniref:GNAT family N-acetyltransferase n=1 Tax=Parasedimentitalea marina TaxID=2483033 RepID=A0A3T0N263_9RHOB|nr:GNAT family N-acetyltransferase [Parasedimentitalea marina]AZV78091.1 GNAT family N-acetyltransferase [Parasedimentitalea marina]
MQSGDAIGLLAQWGETPVGVMMLNPCAAIYAGGRFGEISELFVLPEWRSKGVAAELLKAATTLGAKMGWKRLEVGAPNQPEWSRTLDFYCDNGFDEVGPRLRRLI